MPPWVVEMWPLGALAVVLVAAAVTDVRTGLIPNAITYPAVAAALVGHTLAAGLTGQSGSGMGLAGALLGLAVGLLPLLAACLAGGIGGGDAKLMAAVGALMGWRFALATLFYGFAVAAVMAVIVMVRRRIVRRTLGRVGRFLLLVAVASKPADPATADSPKVPFGLALCLGAAAALTEWLLRGAGAARWFSGI